VIHLIIQNN